MPLNGLCFSRESVLEILENLENCFVCIVTNHSRRETGLEAVFREFRKSEELKTF